MKAPVLKPLLTITLTMLIFLASACTGAAEHTGTLEGTVSIGPIWPVERPNETPPVSPEVFAARKVLVYDKDGKKLIETLDIIQIDQSTQGHYSTQLEPGDYIVDINRVGIDHSTQVPAAVQIDSGKTFILDIDIDTGIR